MLYIIFSTGHPWQIRVWWLLGLQTLWICLNGFRQRLRQGQDINGLFSHLISEMICRAYLRSDCRTQRYLTITRFCLHVPALPRIVVTLVRLSRYASARHIYVKFIAVTTSPYPTSTGLYRTIWLIVFPCHQPRNTIQKAGINHNLSRAKTKLARVRKHRKSVLTQDLEVTTRCDKYDYVYAMTKI